MDRFLHHFQRLGVAGGEDDMGASLGQSLGGGGANTVYLPGTQSDWTITTDNATGAQLARNNTTNKVTTLKQVQTIAYYNPTTTALTHA